MGSVIDFFSRFGRNNDCKLPYMGLVHSLQSTGLPVCETVLQIKCVIDLRILKYVI